MKILKYKKISNGRYKVILDNSELVLYEDVILKYNLLINKEIDDNELININNDNQFFEVYYCALQSLKSRFKSEYDVYNLLLKKSYPNDLVDLAIEKLIVQGYLDDSSFAKAYINNQIVTTNKGPNKIRKELLVHHVDPNIINEQIALFSEEEQLEKITKLANRLNNNNRSKGGSVLKNKIFNYLVNYGYDISLIQDVLNSLDFSIDNDIAKKEYDKIYRKLSRKYSGDELMRKVHEKMYMKGLHYEEVE